MRIPLVLLLLCGFVLTGSGGSRAAAQSVEFRPVERHELPGPIDSNSPTFWRDGQLHLLSSDGTPVIRSGPDQFSLGESREVKVDRIDHFPMWIESVWQDPDGTLFGWYHHERIGVCSDSSLTMPEIGAVISYDEGNSFIDLGIILSSGDPLDCSARNGFFASGHGDFSVIVDRKSEYFYFLFSSYGGENSSQGVAIARLPFYSRWYPAGAVAKYFEGEWKEPGLGGRTSAVFPATVGWQQAETDSFWGASVHWNTFLNKYVVLLNRSCCEPGWPQEGVYLSFNGDIADPAGWSKPQRISDAETWYPQLLGLGPAETDTEAGEVVRFYIRGVSDREMVFKREEEPAAEPVSSSVKVVHED